MSTDTDFENISQQRNTLYRDQFRRLVSVLIFLLLVGMGLIGAYLFLIYTTPKQNFYASTTTGEVIPIESLSEPVVTQDFIVQWSKLVVRSAYTFDFNNADKELQANETNFTPDGWNSFLAAMQQSGFLDTVKQKRLFVSSVINGPAVITDQYIYNGQYTWNVQMPVLILFTSASEHLNRQFYINLTIKRVPNLLNARGVAVTNFSANGALNG